MTEQTPRDVIAEWLWTQVDVQDFDDMGAQAADRLIEALERAGFKIWELWRVPEDSR